MSKLDKLIGKILGGTSTISTDEAIKILESLGYTSKTKHTGTSHLVFRKKDYKKIVLVANRKELLKYQIQDLQEILKDEGY